MESFKTVKDRVETKLNVERSLFITNLAPVEDERRAKEFVAEVSKKYRDATHNCYAYRVLSKSNLVEFCSDAGEPAGTAGLPILNTLRRYQLVNVAVVVSRYFGGVKLGVRGLIEAYTKSAEEAVVKASIVEKHKAYKYRLRLDFAEYGKRMNQLQRLGAVVTSITYLEDHVLLEILSFSDLNLPNAEETEVVYI